MKRLIFKELARRHGIFIREDEVEGVPECEPLVSNWETQSLRIAAIFIILVSSSIGVFLPIILSRALSTKNKLYFVTKYFGSGVILATAFIHLLSPAEEALSDPCLGDYLPDYDWAMGIALMTLMVMFFVELFASRAEFNLGGHSHGGAAAAATVSTKHEGKAAGGLEGGSDGSAGVNQGVGYPSQDHLGHVRDHHDDEANVSRQITAILILEFGVLFHSFFVGLALSGSDDVKILTVVLTFHQMFEGLGLGSRLATTKWPTTWVRFTPWLLAAAYALITPLAIAIGLGVKESLADSPAKTLLTNGIFDAISAGILLYVAIAELLAHEFLFSPEMRNAPLRVSLYAYACVALGCGLMALLGKWA